MFQNIQPAVKKETKRVTVMTLTGVVLMWIVLFILHLIFPETVPFTYTTILGGLGGGLVAVGNFFFMALGVQKAAGESSEDTARTRIKASYSQRMMGQTLWVVLVCVLPCFNFLAGILPLVFPSFGIRIAEFLKQKKS